MRAATRSDSAAEHDAMHSENSSKHVATYSENASTRATMQCENDSERAATLTEIASKRAAMQSENTSNRAPTLADRLPGHDVDLSTIIPAKLPPHTKLFDVPAGLCRIFDRDLSAAGIPKRDDRNRVVDIHALRVTFGTHLCAAGVPLRTAQAAMRHSKPELTANIYTDPKLLDVKGAICTLPELSISDGKGLKNSSNSDGDNSHIIRDSRA